jgi:hypothetical protein
MKAEISSAKLSGPANLELIKSDLIAVGKIAQLSLSRADEIALEDVVFAEAQ